MYATDVRLSGFGLMTGNFGSVDRLGPEHLADRMFANLFAYPSALTPLTPHDMTRH
jgi:hypothetical protein